MNLKMQKRVTASLLDVGAKRIWFDPNRLDEIKEAITKADLRSLIKDKAIQIKNRRGISKGRAKKNIQQKKKGRRHGKGSRQGKRTTRMPRKTSWISRVRLQRQFANYLREKKLIALETYRDLRSKIGGGYFRSKRHIKLYIEEHNLFIKHGKK